MCYYFLSATNRNLDINFKISLISSKNDYPQFFKIIILKCFYEQQK